MRHEAAIEFAVARLRQPQVDSFQLAVAGHRVVHGGLKFTQPMRVDQNALAALEALVPPAPLHQPHNLGATRAVARHKPDLPQIACFDTAFHLGRPDVTHEFAIPRRLTE